MALHPLDHHRGFMTQLDCTTCQDALADCLDAGVAPSGEAASHLAGCAACTQAWVSLQEAWTALRPEGLALSSEAQARVLAYAAAHVPAGEVAPVVTAKRPFGGWFWGVFALALALVLWKFAPAGSDAPVEPKASTEVAVIDLPVGDKPADEKLAERPARSGSAEPVALRAEEAVAPAAGVAPAPAEPARASKLASPPAQAAAARPEVAKEEVRLPLQEPSVALVEGSRARLRSAAAEADDRPMAAAPEPASSRAEQALAAAPMPRAAAPKAAVRESVGGAAAGNSVSDGTRAVAPAAEAPPALEPGVRAAIFALAAEMEGGSGSRLRAALGAPSAAAFESVLSGCGAEALLCDGAALGAGAMRASARRADATPLLQRAARSANPAIAAAARRLLSGQ